MIYFDNAATSGVKPEVVINAVTEGLKNYSANPGRSGHQLSVNTANAVYKVREKVADFFNASGAENVVFTLNCTHSINCVLKGVLHKGDHILVSSLEHNAVMRPLKKTGVSWDAFSVSPYDDTETLKELVKRIKPNTKMIMCTGASNVFGRVLPIEKIGEIARQKGLLFAVDAAQIAGVFPIDIKKMNIDYLCLAPHKGLFAPMGVGILICEKPIWNTVLEGGTGTNSVEINQPDTLPERLESGTLAVPSILGIGAGIDFLKKTGVEKIHNYEMQLSQMIYSSLERNENVILYTPNPQKYRYAPVISFNFKGVPSETVASLLNEEGIAVRGGLHCAPMAHKQFGTLNTGTVRVSVGAFNTKNEVVKFLNIINGEKFIKKLQKVVE